MNNSIVRSSDKVFISERFRKAVALHIIKNLIPQESLRVPLLLGIHGPSGEGKTYQCEQILNEIDAKSFLISGGQLESHEAGEPAQLIRSTYLNAGNSIINKECQVAVVLINDIDTGLGSWGDSVQYTINRQTVFGELMHLVDYPTFVEGRNTIRIPIIITGNDFTKLYEPLVRVGRMSSFEWRPNQDEKVKVVAHMFSNLTIEECANLVKEFKRQPIAFFAHLKSVITDNYLWDEIQQIGIIKAIYAAKSGHSFDLNLNDSWSYENILETGKVLIESGQLLDHLKLENG